MAERSSAEVRSLGERPDVSALVLALAIHIVGLIFVVLAVRPGPSVQVPLIKEQSTKGYPGTVYLSLNPKPRQGLSFTSQVRRRAQRPRVQELPGTLDGAATQRLREQAKQATAGITNSIRFRGIYGFAPGADYRLAVQTAGEFPTVSASEVPPHFEQYVVIEITIDTEGKVADARIVAGSVDRTIEQKLLSAVREFKYTPATRDGSPIPSQRDIVIHIPT